MCPKIDVFYKATNTNFDPGRDSTWWPVFW